MSDQETLNPTEKKWLNTLLSNMQSMDEVQASLKMLIYGDSGVGKTVEAVHIAQAITAPDSTIIYVDSAQNWPSLNNFPQLKNRVMKMAVTSSSQMDDIANAIRQGISPFDRVGCVVIDEHSSIADYDLLAVAKAKSMIDGKSTDKDPDQPTQPDMGVSTNRMHKFTSGLIQLPNTHVILVAHQRIDRDNLGVTRTSPSYMPKLSSIIRGLVHVVGRLTADGVPDKEGGISYRRELQVNPTRTIVAKTRIGGLPVQVTVNQFIAATKEWIGGTRPTQKVDVLAEDEIQINTSVIADETETLETESIA